MSAGPPGRLRRRVYLVLEGGRATGAVGAIVEALLVFLIVGNVVAYSLHTMENVERVWHRELDWFEAASVAIFTLEYALRLWAARASKAARFGSAARFIQESP